MVTHVKPQQTLVSCSLNRFLHSDLLRFVILLPSKKTEDKWFRQPCKVGPLLGAYSFLTQVQKEEVETWLRQVEQTSATKIIVVTVDSLRDYPGNHSRSIDDFAAVLFVDAYAMANAPQGDSILVLLARLERQVSIQLGSAYGHRTADVQRIMNGVIMPAFKKGHYDMGVTQGVRVIIKEFTEVQIGFPWRMFALISIALAGFMIALSLVLSGKRGWGYVFIGLALVGLLFVFYAVVLILRHSPRDTLDGTIINPGREDSIMDSSSQPRPERDPLGRW